MKRKYKQGYRSDWEQNPLFSTWLSRAKVDNTSAYCKACNSVLAPRLSVIKEHSETNKHKKCLIGYSGQSSVAMHFKKNTVSDEAKKAELKICAVLAEHNVSFLVMDHLSEVLGKCFHDSEIAQKFSCKRTKAASIIYNVLAPELENKFIAEMVSSNSSTGPIFSLIIDESTDISTKKNLAIATKYYSNDSLNVKTKLLTMVEIEGETAQQIYDALVKALSDKNLELKNCVGFAADTTNVMFGQQGGVVAKIRAHNPSCVFIKCVCYSVALATSYASKKMPRALEQILKEVYNYFSYSSKRNREFAEYQDFFNSEKHNILKHYDIRWLSFHACINRILEQWAPLKLYFQNECLTEKSISAEFLFNSFSNEVYKLYFYALDYILPLVNKFNIIFQGDYANIHNLYKDITEMFLTVLSCFMKNSYINSTNVWELDPQANMHYLPLNQIYLGVKVGQHVNSIPAPELKTFFQRTQLFLVELGIQLKSRLPFENEFLRNLFFLNPQEAIFGEFKSLASSVQLFPNVVPNSDIQIIDNEYRQLKFDQTIKSYVDSSNSSNSSSCSVSNLTVDKFWGYVGKIKDGDASGQKLKYGLLSRFAKAMLVLPASNVACERIFSQVNLIKTKNRNRFTIDNVNSILQVKQGISDLNNGCTTFEPSIKMIKMMDTKTLYKNISED